MPAVERLNLTDLRVQYADALARLEEQGAAWLEARAKGAGTDPIADRIREVERESRRLEKKIRKAEKREAR